MRGDVTAGFDSIGIFEYGGILPIQDALDFIVRPDVERPLTGRRLSRSNSAVGILGAGAAPATPLRLTHRKIQNVARGVGTVTARPRFGSVRTKEAPLSRGCTC